jgi:hypothetical protein
MWPKRASKKDEPPTYYESDEKTSPAHSDVKSQHDSLSGTGDDWNEKTLVSDDGCETAS